MSHDTGGIDNTQTQIDKKGYNNGNFIICNNATGGSGGRV